MKKNLAFRSISRCHIGLVRVRNQDAVFADDAAALWAVSDGMGGHDAGEVASGLIVQGLAQFAPESLNNVAQTVARILADTNSELIRRASERTPRASIGATVAALVVAGYDAHCIWAGDSRVYRHRHGELQQVTRDHRYVQELVDGGLLAKQKAERDPNAHIITRAIGIHPDPELDFWQGDVEAGDVFFLATDGVTNVCSDQEIAEALGNAQLEASAASILNLCLARGAPDNLAFVIVHAE